MNLSTTRARMLTVAGIGVAAVVVIGGTATAASQITAHQLATGAVNSRVIRDGTIHQRDLSTGTNRLLHQADGLQAQIDRLGKQGTAAITQLQQELTNLQNEVQALEPTNTGWSIDNDEGQITGAHTADVTETNDSATGASLSNGNVSLPYAAGDKLSFGYTFSGGAAQGWGAPRVIALIDGTWYTTIGNVHPEYGTKDATGVWQQSNSLVKFNDNSETPAPSGTITALAVVYDNLPDPGTVHVHDLTVGDQVIDFR
ncbi:MAG: hypothetical protein J2P22_07245 [Nocardioides sp.]|nr:hypothetical protein [Nocardioides sp.]